MAIFVGGGELLSATTTPTPITDDCGCSLVIVQCDYSADPLDDLWVGYADHQSSHLRRGGVARFPVENANEVYVRAGSGTVPYNWSAMQDTV